MEGVRVKFLMELDPYAITADYLKVKDFEDLPKMIKKLTLDELKSFFVNQAKKLGKSVTKE